MEMLRDWCYFPHLKDEVSVGNFSLGGIKIQYPVGIAAGMFKDVSRVPWELFGEGGMQVGFITVGGITRDPQPGNPKRRHFSFPAKE
jgi:dihydroorotate dehydrogenase